MHLLAAFLLLPLAPTAQTATEESVPSLQWAWPTTQTTLYLRQGANLVAVLVYNGSAGEWQGSNSSGEQWRYYNWGMTLATVRFPGGTWQDWTADGVAPGMVLTIRPLPVPAGPYSLEARLTITAE